MAIKQEIKMQQSTKNKHVQWGGCNMMCELQGAWGGDDLIVSMATM